jgi:hypothetical protein
MANSAVSGVTAWSRQTAEFQQVETEMVAPPLKQGTHLARSGHALTRVRMEAGRQRRIQSTMDKGE